MYIHAYIIITWEYVLSNNNSFIVVSFTILFLSSIKIPEGIMTHPVLLFPRIYSERKKKLDSSSDKVLRKKYE